jgi:hypothetical protein
MARGQTAGADQTRTEGERLDEELSAPGFAAVGSLGRGRRELLHHGIVSNGRHLQRLLYGWVE